MASSSRIPPRGRDDKKLTDGNKVKSNINDENCDSGKGEEGYEFKSSKDVTEPKNSQETDLSAETTATNSSSSEETSKRGFLEMNDNIEENTEDESRKKKRKDEGAKDKNTLRGTSQNKGQTSKPNLDKSNKGSNLNVNKAGKYELVFHLKSISLLWEWIWG